MSQRPDDWHRVLLAVLGVALVVLAAWSVLARMGADIATGSPGGDVVSAVATGPSGEDESASAPHDLLRRARVADETAVRLLVLDPTRRPVPGASVFAYTPKPAFETLPPTIGRTDSGGLALLQAPARSRVAVVASGFVPRIVRVESGEVTVVLLAEAHSQEVFCVDLWGRPLEGIEIYASASAGQAGPVPGLDPRNRAYSAKTARDGRATLEGMGNGWHVVHAIPPEGLAVYRSSHEPERRVSVPGPPITMVIGELQAAVLEVRGDSLVRTVVGSVEGAGNGLVFSPSHDARARLLERFPGAAAFVYPADLRAGVPVERAKIVVRPLVARRGWLPPVSLDLVPVSRVGPRVLDLTPDPVPSRDAVVSVDTRIVDAAGASIQMDFHGGRIHLRSLLDGTWTTVGSHAGSGPVLVPRGPTRFILEAPLLQPFLAGRRLEFNAVDGFVAEWRLTDELVPVELVVRLEGEPLPPDRRVMFRAVRVFDGAEIPPTLIRVDAPLHLSADRWSLTIADLGCEPVEGTVDVVQESDVRFLADLHLK